MRDALHSFLVGNTGDEEKGDIEYDCTCGAKEDYECTCLDFNFETHDGRKHFLNAVVEGLGRGDYEEGSDDEEEWETDDEGECEGCEEGEGSDDCEEEEEESEDEDEYDYEDDFIDDESEEPWTRSECTCQVCTEMNAAADSWGDISNRPPPNAMARAMRDAINNRERML